MGQHGADLVQVADLTLYLVSSLCLVSSFPGLNLGEERYVPTDDTA